MNETNKKMSDYMEAQTALYISLTMSDLRTYPQLYAMHPGVQLCQTFSSKAGVFLEEVMSDLYSEVDVSEKLIRDLMDLNVAPIPSIEALYRVEKKSHQKAFVLGALARSLKKIMSNNYDDITVELIAPAMTNTY
jgi:hypothetical protein